MRGTLNALLALTLLLAASSASALPMVYEFSYRDTGDNIFSGRLVGDLQPDMDTVIVSSVFDLRHSLFDTIGLEYETALFPGYDRVSLTGAAMRFGSIGPGQGSSKVYWAFGDFLQPLSDAQLYLFSAGTAGSGSAERTFFVPSRWEVEAVGRVSLPGSLGLVLCSLTLIWCADIGSSTRKRLLLNP